MEKSLHIGIDARLWQETGIGRYIRNLISQLQKIDKQHRYTLFISPKDREVIQSSVKSTNWRLVDAPLHWHTLEEQVQFPAIIEKEQVDLMHFPYFSVPVLYKKPFVVTIHDLINHHFPTGKASTLAKPLYLIKQLGYRYVMHHAVKASQKIIAVSHATEKELVKTLHVPHSKIAVTYEGYDSLIAASEKSSPLNDPYFLYVGNAYPHKNLERLLQAFQLFTEKIKSPIKLVLVGKEDYFYNRLHTVINELDLQKSVVLTGHVSDDSLAQYYDHAIALIAPSLMEGFGLPVLEAMSRGVQIGASDIPVFHELCEDVPIYFDPFHTEIIANCLEKLYKEGKTYANTKKKGQLLAKNFSWEKMAKETKAVYESCARLR